MNLYIVEYKKLGVTYPSYVVSESFAGVEKMALNIKIDGKKEVNEIISIKMVSKDLIYKD